ncbi:hypothetical protein GQ44DRAFT_766563 [Phaeosphaeriaceae sp. PMI808]|nr:hypothetical protein GQ44DRAFT_766563 [Phaeosphaeriaceae sp. PMI808]
MKLLAIFIGAITLATPTLAVDMKPRCYYGQCDKSGQRQCLEHSSLQVIIICTNGCWAVTPGPCSTIPFQAKVSTWLEAFPRSKQELNQRFVILRILRTNILKEHSTLIDFTTT